MHLHFKHLPAAQVFALARSTAAPAVERPNSVVTRELVLQAVCLVGLAASAEGCSTKVIGQIVLVIQTDLSLPKDIDTIRIEGVDAGVVRAAAEAAGKFRQALALDPYHPAALGGLIEACDRLGQSEAAQRYRNRAERLRRRTGA